MPRPYLYGLRFSPFYVSVSSFFSCCFVYCSLPRVFQFWFIPIFGSFQCLFDVACNNALSMPLSYLAIKNVSPHSLRTPLDFVAALFVFIHLYSLSVYTPFHLRLRIAIYLWVCYEPTSAVYLGKMVFLLFLTKFHLLACSPFLKCGSRGILIYRLLNG